jgi:Na+/melibiose symporter-like transporter
MTAEPEYVRAKKREGKVPLPIKIFQGLGALPEAIKNFGFGTFLLFYYNQVLGLPAFPASAAIALALIADAVFDPFVGSFSDRLKTKWGRRHGLMYLSSAPLAVAIYAAFSPPPLQGTALAVWLFAAAVATNLAMSLFVVPWTALYAEFSDDYAERTTLVTFRHAVGWPCVILFTLLTWTFIFPSSPQYTPGQLNPHGYRIFAWVLALVVAAGAFLTTFLTRSEVPYLLQPTKETPPFSFVRLGRDVRHALANPDFAVLILGVLSFAAIAGTIGALGIYMNTYFWGLTPEQLRWFSFIILGAFAAFLVVTWLQRYFDKKTLLLAALALQIFDGSLVVGARLLNLLPPNGDKGLLIFLIANTIFSVFLGTILGIMFLSMIADTLDAQELRTGLRQEGMFAAAQAFAGKATTGLGTLISGFLLQFVVRWPTHVNPHHLDPAALTRLGLYGGILVPCFFIFVFMLGSFYRITRQSHAETIAALEQRRKETSRREVLDVQGERPVPGIPSTVSASPTPPLA